MELSVPQRMKALQLVKYFSEGFPDDPDAYLGEHFAVNEVDVPKPNMFEVLVRMERSPINPAGTHLFLTFRV